MLVFTALIHIEIVITKSKNTIKYVFYTELLIENYFNLICFHCINVVSKLRIPTRLLSMPQENLNLNIVLYILELVKDLLG